MTTDNALIIFIKNPEKGKVKTRLAKTLGEDAALKIYKALLAHTQKIALSVAAERYLFYSDYIPENDNWSKKDFKKQLQSKGDLGDKMSNAFQYVLQQHQRAIIIGSDCASLTPEIINAAFQKLEEFPFVIGPALDGGYYLLGMKQHTPSLFQNMEWSTNTVFSKTIEKIQLLGRSYCLLPELSDIDEAEDWEKQGWKMEI